MDPAVSDILNKQHEKYTEEIKELNAVFDKLSDQLQSLARLFGLPSPSPPPRAPDLLANSPSQTCEPFIPTPARFSGTTGSCRQFILQCNLVFEQQPCTYRTDRSKVAFVMCLLSDKAAAWATALSDSKSPALLSYQSFQDELLKVFDNSVQREDAGVKLLSLKQGSSSVFHYSVDFRILAMQSGWNEPPLCYAYYEGLNDAVKDLLVTRDEPSSLDQLISLTIRLDQLQERFRDRQERRTSYPVSSANLSPHLALPPPSLDALPDDSRGAGAAKNLQQGGRKTAARHVAQFGQKGRPRRAADS